MKSIIYSLLTIITANTLSYASNSSEPSPPKRPLIHEEPEERVETKQDFIQNFFQGQRTLSKENLAKVGIQLQDQELVQKIYTGDITLYFVLNLCKEGYIKPDDFLEKHREALINANIRANKGNANAAYIMGFIYCFGVCQPQSSTFGEEYMTKAAELGSFQAMLFLSEFYKSGELFEANPEKAKHWSDKSLEYLLKSF